MSIDIKNTRWLIAENATPLAGTKACGCCGNFTLYRVEITPEDSYLLCVDCDTEKR